MEKISIVTVTFNNEETISELINSVRNYLKEYYDEFIIVDNMSKDNTRDLLLKLEKDQGNKIKIILNQENIGYRKAINNGIRLAKNNIVLAINPDSRLLDDSIINCINLLKMDDNTAYCFPRLKGKNGYTYSYYTNEAIPFLEQYPKYSENKLPIECVEVEIPGGAVFAVKKDAFLSVGGFDEEVFMYGEEYEIGLKLREKGYKIVFCPTALVYHKGGHSVLKSKPDRNKRLLFTYYNDYFASAFLYYKYCNDSSLKRFLWWGFFFIKALEHSLVSKSFIPIKIYVKISREKNQFITKSKSKLNRPCKWRILKALLTQFHEIKKALKRNTYGTL